MLGEPNGKLAKAGKKCTVSKIRQGTRRNACSAGAACCVISFNSTFCLALKAAERMCLKHGLEFIQVAEQ